MDIDATVENSEGATTSANDANNLSTDSSTVDAGNNQGDTGEATNETASVEDKISKALSESGAELEEESPASKSDQEDEKSDGKDGENKDDDSEESRLDKHPRFQEVIAERNEAREKLKLYEPEGSTMTETDRVSTLQLGEAVNMALLGKADPSKVLEALQPIIDSLHEATGSKLPDDLVAAVENGDISQEYAQSLAKERKTNEALKNSAEFDKQQSEAAKQKETQEYLEAVKAEVKTAVSDWENQQIAQDPDYEQKRDLVYLYIQGELQARTAKGLLTSSQDAVAISNAALATVTKKLNLALPNKSPVRKNLEGGSPSSKVEQKPATQDEAIRNALNK